ncbi:MAG: terminase family protein [Clostridia bacterium]|nr:terminase family protein [Clostridia bacterium]
MNNFKNIRKLAEIFDELERRNYDALANYNTGKKVHQKQLNFHKSLKRNRWVFGGNRTGKTECGAVETIWLARGIHPYRKNKPNVTGWVVSLSTRVQKEVAQEKILKYLNKSWVHDIVMKQGKKSAAEYGVIECIVIKNVFGGLSKIYFKSCEEGRDKFQGASLDFVWFDEEPPEDIYTECRMRVLDRCGDVFGTMTPLKGLTYIYDQIYLNEFNDTEVYYDFMEWADNPFLSEKEVERLSSTLSAEDVEARRYGRFVNKNNSLVYKEFNEKINVVEPFEIPRDWQDTISIDPGLNNPLSAHWYCVDYDGNVFVVAEHFDSGKDVTYHAQKIKEICARLGWKRAQNGMYSALIDSAANQRTLASQKSVTELFYDNGILVNPKVNKDLFSGINRVKSYLKNLNGESKLFIFASCTNLIREIKNYFWSDGDNPVKKDDHCLDELRYYIMSRPEPTKKTNTQISRDKERLFQALRRQNRYQ